MGLKSLIIDMYTAVSHKTLLDPTVTASHLRQWQAPSWVPEPARRRLAAYQIFAAYDQNGARHFLKPGTEAAEENREYGDAALIVDSVLSSLLGETQEIVVEGADRADDLESADDTGGEQLDEEKAAEAAKVLALAERQAFLREWADDVHLPIRVQDCERRAVLSGDGVYVIGWDARRGRPVPAVQDPGFYFPVLPRTLDGYEYPERVHLAWEIPGEDFDDGKPRLRRVTYELGDIMPRWVEREDGQLVETLIEGDRYDADGRVVRVYPWDPEPSATTCYVTDATWILDDTNATNSADVIDTLSLENASFEIDDVGEPLRRYDLGFDFVPVVHVPNTVAGADHFGQSSLSRVAQILDDLQAVDTDSQRASSTAGSPIVAVSGTRFKEGEREVRLGGSVVNLGENGRMDVVDTSDALRELRAMVKDMRDRLSTNSRLPAAVLGLIDASDVPSGYALQLSFGPLNALVRQLRLTRSVKYPLMLKMVQKLYQLNGVLEPGPLPRAEYRLGSYMPGDLAGVIEQVCKAHGAGVISLETAVEMLIDVGLPIRDMVEEIAQIESRDFEGAYRLAEATADIRAALEYLGRTPDAASPPAVPQPGVPTPPVPSS